MDRLDRIDFALDHDRLGVADFSDESLGLVAVATVRVDIAYPVVAAFSLFHRSLRLVGVVRGGRGSAHDNGPEWFECRTANAKECVIRWHPRCEIVPRQSKW